MRLNRPMTRSMLAAPAVAAVLLAGACSSNHQAVHPGGASAPVPPASVRVAHLHAGKLGFGKRLQLHVANGDFSRVRISQPGLGRLDGDFNKTRTRWRSANVLAPSSHITATISYVDLAHKTTQKTVSIHTPGVKQHFNTFISPSGGVTLGVGTPIIVTFDRSIPKKQRAAAEAGLSVKTTPAVVGAWHWMSGNVVHWRPPTYWKPGTKVTVSADMQGVKVAKGVWGAAGRHTASFKIGASHISEANQATHEMKVYDNGKLIRTFPISTGREQYPTMDGIHIALQKNSVIEMNSATVGIPKGSPDYYDEIVYWDVRISNGGEFVHAAPWSVGEQGHVNVSHGCVNLSTENAEWFFNWARDGDIVDIYNGIRPVELGDAGTADWNMSWKKWLAGDAAPTAAERHVHARYPRTYEPNFTPKSIAHHKAAEKAAKKHRHDAKKHSTKNHSHKSSSSTTTGYSY